MISLLLNNQELEVESPPEMLLLDWLRRERGLTGTKEGCREGDCGACTVLLGEWTGESVRYRAVPSCLVPLGDCAGCHVVTIEELNSEELNPVQAEIVAQGATQCGFCTPGVVVSLTGFLLSPEPVTAENAVAALDGNICRCTGYLSLRRAAASLAEKFSRLTRNGEDLEELCRAGVLPGYFREIPRRLSRLAAGGAPSSEPLHSGLLPVAGGTDLLVQRREGLPRGKTLLLGRRRELRGIKVEKGICRLGAGVTFEEIHRSPELSRSFPGFSRAFRRVASTIVRHRATLGGNIVNASPIADAVIMLLALDAEVLLEKERRQRRIPLREFYLGYKQTALRDGELVREVSFALPGRDDYFNFEKVSQREHLDIAAVNSALWLRLDKGVIRDVRLSAGGVAPVPLFLEGVSASLKGQRLEEEAVFQAARSVGREISPISDVRGSARYKKLLLEKLILGHFQELGFIGK